MISGSDQGQAYVNSTGRQMCPSQCVEYYFPIKLVHEDFCIPGANNTNNKVQNITQNITLEQFYTHDVRYTPCPNKKVATRFSQ